MIVLRCLLLVLVAKGQLEIYQKKIGTPHNFESSRDKKALEVHKLSNPLQIEKGSAQSKGALKKEQNLRIEAEDRKYGTSKQEQNLRIEPKDPKHGTSKRERNLPVVAEDLKHGTWKKEHNLHMEAEDQEHGTVKQEHNKHHEAEDWKHGTSRKEHNLHTAAEDWIRRMTKEEHNLHIDAEDWKLGTSRNGHNLHIEAKGPNHFSSNSNIKSSVFEEHSQSMHKSGLLTNEFTDTVNAYIDTKGRMKRDINEGESPCNYTSDYCGEVIGSCKFAMGKSKWLCSCDFDCHIFDHCCCDFEDTTTASIELKYQFQCYNMYYSAYQMYKSFTNRKMGFLAVGSCPKSYDNQTIIDKCENGDILDAGTFVMNNKTVPFKNKMCAKCNGIESYETFKLQVFVDDDLFEAVDTNRNKSSLTLFEILYTHEEAKIFGIQYIVKPPEGSYLRGCLLPTQYHQSTTSNSSMCYEYINPVLVLTRDKMSRRMRNIHCTDSLDVETIICIRDDDFVDTSTLLHNRNDYMMAVLFTFSEPEENDEDKCSVWRQEMTETGLCDNLDVYNDVRKTLELSWRSDRNLTRDDLLQIVHITPWLFTVDKVSSGHIEEISLQDKGFIANVKLSIKYFKTSFLHEIESFMNIVRARIVVLNVYDVNGSYTTKLELTNGFQNISIAHTISHNFAWLESLERGLELANIHIDHHYIKYWSSHVFIKAIYQNTALTVDKVLLYTNGNTQDSAVTIPIIITYSCMSLSILALLVLIISQRQRGHVTHLPAANTENTAVSLLLAESLFLTGRNAAGYETLCYLLGCITHYLWLMFFAFMSISVGYMVVTFCTLRQTAVNRDFMKQRIKLSLLGCLVPFPFVGLSVCVDHFGPSYWGLDYASSSCFPERFPSNLVFLTGPIVASLLFNLVCLVVIVSKLFTIRRSTLHVRKLDLYQEAVIYLRIVVVSGLFWVTGLAASLFEEDWLYVAFTVLCGLHGFFFSVSVLTSNKAKKDTTHRKGIQEQNQDVQFKQSTDF